MYLKSNCKNTNRLILILLLVLSNCNLFGQSKSDECLPYIQALGRHLYPSEIFKPNIIQKKPGHYLKDDWAAVIDTTWGAGLPTSEKLQIFDSALNEIDQRYGAFVNYDVNIDSIRNIYRPMILQGVSRGRFAAIMNHFSLALKDAHTVIADIPVNWGTALLPGVPLFVIGSRSDNHHFGACLTPLPDSSLLVYKSLSNHVLGLVPGDIVLGYDGIHWKDIYKQLLATQLPISLSWVWGSTNESMTHIMLQSAGQNWHLFDTIDIVKYSTGDTLHLSTTPLSNQTGRIWGNEQLTVPGVPMPHFWNYDFISWGIVNGKKIGYIYIAAIDQQFHNGQQLYQAVYELINDGELNGLILDLRLNYGGTFGEANLCYSLLFNSSFTVSGFDVRGNPYDHLDMVPHPYLTPEACMIPGDPATFYDKPIAVLTGPNSASGGDWITLKMKHHPMVRTFGKASNGAFTLSDNPDLGNSDWFFEKATGCGFLTDNHQYLAHTGVEVNEDVWLKQKDVVRGKDTVVEAAIAWINSLTNVEENNTDNAPLCFKLCGNYPNPFNPTTTINFQLPSASNVTLKIYNINGQLVKRLLSKQMGAGHHEIQWDGINESGGNVGSGIYIFRLKAGNYIGSRKMTLLR